MSTDSIINIIINTVKKGGGDKDQISSLKKVNQAVKEFTGLNLGAITAAGGLISVVKSGANFVIQSTKNWIDYNMQIRDAAKLTGNEVEQMSRLAQVADDLFIPIDTFTKALQTASTRGIDVSVDGMGRLMEKYNSFGTASEKAKFLAETFGKANGPEMQYYMEMGSEELERRTALVADNMVVTDESIAQSVEMKEQLDQLNDTWEGFANTVGKTALPELIKTLGALNAILSKDQLLLDIQKKQTDMTGMAGYSYEHYTRKILENARAAGVLHYSVETYMDSMRRGKPLPEELAKKIGLLSEEEYKQKYLTDDVRESLVQLRNEGYEYSDQLIGVAESQKKVTETTDGIKTSLVELGDIDISFGDKIAGQIQKITWMQAGGGELQRLGQEIDQALTDHKITPEQAKTMYEGLFLQNEALMLKQGENKDELVANIMETFGVTQTEAAAMLDTVYKDYDNRLLHWTVIIDTVNSGNGTAADMGGASADDFTNQSGSGYAKGADFVVPPGYPNDSYPMRVQSGEHVVVTPPGQSSSGGTIINNFYGLSVDEVMRKLQAQGAGRL